MKILLFASLLFVHPARAEVVPAGPPLVQPTGTDGLTALDNPGTIVRGAWRAVKAGHFYEAAALGVIALLALLRAGGERFHAWLRDDHPLDKFLWFLFDTKPGRILKLALTTAAAGVVGAWLLGEPITPDLVNPILGVTFASSTIYGWLKDFWEWLPDDKGPKAWLLALLVSRSAL